MVGSTQDASAGTVAQTKNDEVSTSSGTNNNENAENNPTTIGEGDAAQTISETSKDDSQTLVVEKVWQTCYKFEATH